MIGCLGKYDLNESWVSNLCHFKPNNVIYYQAWYYVLVE